MESGELKGYTSVVVLDEVFHRLMLTELYTTFNVLPRKASSTIHSQPEILSKLKTCFEDIFALHRISHLTILPVDGELQKRAVQLSREYQLMSRIPVVDETYDEIVRKILYIAKNIGKNPQLSEKTIKEIEEARKRIKESNFYTEEEVKKTLGL